MSYALALVHLGDRCVGGGPFVQKFPGSEPAPTLAEIQEIQRRLTALGFDTGGADGRIGIDTTLAAHNFQRKNGIEPADGYAGTGLLARLRQDREWSLEWGREWRREPACEPAPDPVGCGNQPASSRPRKCPA